jgi:hypothetical protein
MTQEAMPVAIRIDGEREQLDDLARHLRTTLETGQGEVEVRSAGELPEGAKGLGVLGLGGVVIELARSSGLLDRVAAAVQAWLGQQGGRSVRLEIDGDVLDVSGLSGQEQRELVQTWIARHAAPSS